jgi:hypothetical protein
MSLEDSKVLEYHKKMETIHRAKTERSNHHFKNTKVTSCSGVLMHNGKSVALSFSTGNPKPFDI